MNQEDSSRFPTCDQFEQLFVAAFKASVETEEGRDVTASFLVNWPQERTLTTFAEPIPLTPMDVVKLSPICQRPNHFLVISLNEGTASIIGLHHRERDFLKSDDPSRWNRGLPPLDYLKYKLHILGPAHLRVVVQEVAFEWKAGTVRELSPLITTAVSSLSWHCDWIRHDVIVGVLRNIVGFMARQRHGGAIFFVPEQSFDKPTLQSRYRMDSGLLQDAVTRRSARKGGETPDDGELAFAENALSKAELFVASLTLIDGATVLSKDLRVFGFGVVLPLPSNDTNQIDVENVEGSCSPIDLQGLGTRHRSAYWFCSQTKDSIGVVVSQDGHITVVSNCEGRFRVEEHVEPNIIIADSYRQPVTDSTGNSSNDG